MKVPKITKMNAFLALGAIVVLAAAGAWWFLAGGQTVAVVKVAEGSLDEIIRAPAQIKARVPVTLSARLTATVVSVAADFGDRVRKDQLLVRLDDRDTQARVAAAKAALARAQADLALAASNERRDREVFAQGYISQAAMEATATLRVAKEAEVAAAAQELRFAETQASFTRLTSPMDGVVVARLAEPGDTVAPGTPILRLVDPQTLQAVARVDETVAGRIQPGMPATIRLRAGGEVPGKVTRVQLEADPAARELNVEIAFDQPPERFAIDQEAEVGIRVGNARGLVIPLSALVQREGQSGVLVVRGGRARFQRIETGALGEGQLIVRAGLQAGEIIVRAAQSVRPDARVRVATEH